MILKQWLEKEESAKIYLDNANRWLEAGDSINRVPGEMEASVFWVIEGWLVQRGIEPDFRSGWGSMKAQFFKLAPKELSQMAMRILAKTTLLESEIEGYSPSREWSLERWNKEAKNCITEIKRFIEVTGKNLSSQSSNLRQS